MLARPLKSVLSVLTLALALGGCGPRRIAGTNIRDNADTRGVVAVIDQYRQAVERRDADAVLALVSPSYFDDMGTPDPTDDLDYDQLRKVLPQNYRQLTSVRLGIGVREIDVNGDRATANITFDGHYRVSSAGGETAKTTSDVAQMRFIREAGKWMITSGL